MIQFAQIQTQDMKTVQSFFTQLTGEKSGAAFDGILEQSQQRLASTAQPEKNAVAETNQDQTGRESITGSKQNADNEDEKEKASGGDENTQALFGLSAALLVAFVQENTQQTADSTGQTETCTAVSTGMTGMMEPVQSGKPGIAEAPAPAMQALDAAGTEILAAAFPETEKSVSDAAAAFADTSRESQNTLESQSMGAVVPQEAGADGRPVQAEEPEDTDFHEAVSATSGTQPGLDMQAPDRESRIVRTSLHDRDTALTAETGEIPISVSENKADDGTAAEKLQIAVLGNEKDSGSGKNAEAGGLPAGAEQLSATWMSARFSAEGLTAEKTFAEDRPVFEQIAQQVVQTVNTAERDGEYVFDMKLFPEGLGKVEVSMVCEGTNLTLTVTAHSGEAGKLLSGQSEALRNALAENYQVSDLHIRMDTDAAVQTALAFSDGGQAADHSGGNALVSQADRIFDDSKEKSGPEETAPRLDSGILNTRV